MLTTSARKLTGVLSGRPESSAKYPPSAAVIRTEFNAPPRTHQTNVTVRALALVTSDMAVLDQDSHAHPPSHGSAEVTTGVGGTGRGEAVEGSGDGDGRLVVGAGAGVVGRGGCWRRGGLITTGRGGVTRGVRRGETEGDGVGDAEVAEGDGVTDGDSVAGASLCTSVT